MSTKSIRKALSRLAELEDGSGPEMLAALLEVERIERAAKDYKFRKSIESIEALEEVLSDIAKDAP